MSLVSAIITTKNRKNLLEKAIQSVLTQTYTEIECIVVVDGSDDGTCEEKPIFHVLAVSQVTNGLAVTVS